MIKKILLFLLVALIIIQFFRPKQNLSEGVQPNAIANNYPVSEDVHTILGKACNDCHTNNSRYPWYNNIQPVAWWLNNHINEGKHHFNLDEHNKLPLWVQYKKMEEVIDQIKKGEMPLDSYTWVHKDAILTQTEKEKVTGWAQSVMDSMKRQYPADSLIRKRK